MVLKSGVNLPMQGLVGPKIECEICFLLNNDLEGKNLTIAEVLAATEGVSASFEICDARIKDWKCPYPDFFADNGFSCRVVLPGGWRPVGELDLLEETVVLTQDANQIAEGKGAAAMGHPANAVIWLAGKLADRGKGLKAGQFVMTGTLTPILAIEKGSAYTANFSSLGKISITFS
jgi:2-keto-4-pentenoate hydratase